MGIKKSEISKKLYEVATLLELAGANVFKTRAFNTAAEIIEAFPGASEDFLEAFRAGKVPGIGPGIKLAIESLVSTHALPEDLEKEISAVPRSLLELLQLPGVGPKKAKSMYEVLQVSDLASFEKALKAGQIQELKGFSEKSIPKFEKALEDIAYRSKCALWANAENFLKTLVPTLQAHTKRFEFCGEFRRLCNFVTGYSIVVESIDQELLVKKLVEVIGECAAITATERGFQIDVAKTPTTTIIFSNGDSFWFEVFESTGCTDHVQSITAKLNGKKTFSDEQEIYETAGQPYTAPEHRESEESFATPAIISYSDIKGIVHAHSTYSDGKNTLREMATACKEKGFAYFGISDHSQSAKYAGGLGVDRIERQHREIDELNKELAPFKILKGIESDILKDGSLDYEDAVLAKFDFVVGSVHNGFTLSREEQTERICRALRNKFLTILGHPTGRLLLERDEYEVDLEKIIQVAAEEKKVIEINGNPKRLDLDWKWVKRATSLGVKIILTPDAHSIGQIEYVRYGLNVAAKAAVVQSQLFCFSTVVAPK